MLKRKQRHYPKIFACTFPSAENVSCETRVCQRVRCFTWNIDRPEKVSRETVPPCSAPMFHVEQFRHLFHAFCFTWNKSAIPSDGTWDCRKTIVFPTICVLTSQNTDVRKFPYGNFLPLKVWKPRYTPPVALIKYLFEDRGLRAHAFAQQTLLNARCRAAAVLRKNKLYRQTETEA